MFSLGAGLALTACIETAPPEALAPVSEGIDEVRIVASVGCTRSTQGSGNLCQTISDPDRIARIEAFVDARLEGWSTPFAGAPILSIHVQFYRNGEFIESFGIGAESFERRTFLSRRAKRLEVDEALSLVDLNRSHLRHRTDDPIPG